MHFAHQRTQRRAVLPVVGERAEMDGAERGQVSQQVEGADLVAAIGRERHAVGEKQQFAHQPSPRAIGGPRRLASHSGSRCHAATWSRYLGLSGLISRGGTPSAVRTA